MLSIFHYVVAGLSGFFSLFAGIYILMGVLMLCGRLDSAHPDPAAHIMGWVFIAMGSTFLLFGLTFTVCLVLAGRYVKSHRHYTFCLVMAACSRLLFCRENRFDGFLVANHHPRPW